MTSVIEASTVNVRTLVDGTLRLTVDIDPPQAQAGFALFGAPGRSVAMAALQNGRQEAADSPAAPTPLPEPEKPLQRPARSPQQIVAAAKRWEDLGLLCKAAITIGQSPDFWDFANVADAQGAEHWIKQQCGVTSRKELDFDPLAGATFRKTILGPYRDYLAPRGEEGGAEYEA